MVVHPNNTCNNTMNILDFNTPDTDRMEASLETGNFLKRVGKAMQFARDMERRFLMSEQQNKELTRQVAELLDHCQLEGGECSVCAAIVCPHQCEFHLHHDGCPACAEDGEGEQP